MKLIKHDSFFSDPWTDLDRLFESTLPELYQWNPMRTPVRERSLPLDVFEDEDRRVVRFEVPGINRKDIQLELENSVLSVKAKREDETENGKSTTEFSRSVSVGEDINPEKVEAHLADGMLTIELHKRDAAKPKLITIN